MSKIYMKDIRNICSCIVDLSCQTIRTNEKGAYNKGCIYSCVVYPYGKQVTFYFKENDSYIFKTYSKNWMYEQLLKYYKKGLNGWIELYNSDSFKTKKEKKRLNYYINKLKEFESIVQE